MSMLRGLALATAIGAAGLSGASPAPAAVIDFTTNTGWGGANLSNNSTTSATNAAFGLTLTSSPGMMNSDGFANVLGGAATCTAASGLACAFDGVGIGTGDDEVTGGGGVGMGESLTLDFAPGVSVRGFSVLDLFGPGDSGDAAAESAEAEITHSGGMITHTLTSVFQGNSLGFQSLFFAGLTGVTRIVFTAPGGMASNDFALAAIYTPLPAALLLFGSALLGLGWLRRRAQQPGDGAVPAGA